MAEFLAVASFSYPIVKDLFKIISCMKSAYKDIRFASKDLEKAIYHIETVADAYGLFKDTLKKFRRVRELGPVFKKFEDLIEKIQNRPRRLVTKLERIQKTFAPLLSGSADTAQKWYARLEWYFDGRKMVQALFQDMEVMEKSMNFIAVLMNGQLLYHAYQTNQSNSMLTQIQFLKHMMARQFKEVQNINHNLERQHADTKTQNTSLFKLTQQVLVTAEEHFEQFQQMRPPSQPPTPPAQPSPRIPPASRPVNPTTNHLTAIPTDPEPTDFTNDTITRSQNGDEVQPEEQTQGLYMQIPPFGPPNLGPRPPPGRESPTVSNPSSHIIRTPKPPRGTGRQGGKNGKTSRSRANGNHVRRENRPPRPPKIDVYGNGGEVTPKHHISWPAR